MATYKKKMIWGKAWPRIWASLIMSTLFFGFALVLLITLFRRLDEDNEGFEYVIPFFFFIMLGWMAFSLYIIRKANRNYVIFTKNKIIHYGGEVERKILFKKIKILRSEPMFDIYSGFISLLFSGHYKIYFNDGKTEIYIKDIYFSPLEAKYIFAWLAEYSQEYGFRVQDHAGYLEEIKQPDFTNYKSTRSDPFKMSTKKERQSIAATVFVITIVLVAIILGATYDRGVIVRIKDLSYPEESTTSSIDVEITLENRGDHSARAKDIQVRIYGMGVEEITFRWHENIYPQKTSNVIKKVDIKYDPFPSTDTSYYSIGVTLFYKGDEVDWES